MPNEIVNKVLALKRFAASQNEKYTVQLFQHQQYV